MSPAGILQGGLPEQEALVMLIGLASLESLQRAGAWLEPGTSALVPWLPLVSVTVLYASPVIKRCLSTACGPQTKI